MCCRNMTAGSHRSVTYCSSFHRLCRGRGSAPCLEPLGLLGHLGLLANLAPPGHLAPSGPLGQLASLGPPGPPAPLVHLQPPLHWPELVLNCCSAGWGWACCWSGHRNRERVRPVHINTLEHMYSLLQVKCPSSDNRSRCLTYKPTEHRSGPNPILL